MRSLNMMWCVHDLALWKDSQRLKRQNSPIKGASHSPSISSSLQNTQTLCEPLSPFIKHTKWSNNNTEQQQMTERKKELTLINHQSNFKWSNTKIIKQLGKYSSAQPLRTVYFFQLTRLHKHLSPEVRCKKTASYYVFCDENLLIKFFHRLGQRCYTTDRLEAERHINGH